MEMVIFVTGAIVSMGSVCILSTHLHKKHDENTKKYLQDLGR